MNQDLQNRIYQAQCLGNVEPIEYMVPYPNTSALIEGQNVKHANLVVYDSLGITNKLFFEKVQQTAHWLESLGLKSKDRLFLPPLAFPFSEIIAFGIWYLGATIVIANESPNDSSLKSIYGKNIIPNDIDLFSIISEFEPTYIPKHKPNLRDEAVLFMDNKKVIQLSHYNLLVNTNGIQQGMKLSGGEKIYTDLKAHSMEWLIFQTLLPFYAACLYTSNSPEIILGQKGQFTKQSYTFCHDLTSYSSMGDTSILICPENTCALSFGKEPIHMTNINHEPNHLSIDGHSIMMGYLKENENESIFKNNSMILTYKN